MNNVKDSSFSKESILSNMDSSVGIHFSNFLYLNHGYRLPIESRISLYGDGENWAMIIEKVYYSNRNLDLELELSYFGNCLMNLDSDHLGVNNFKIFILCDEDEIASLSKDDSDDEFELISKESGVDSILIAGIPVEVEYDLQKYKEQKILIRDFHNPNKRPDVVSLFRYLRVRNNELFRANDEQLRTYIPDDLPLIMKIDEWHHEDFVLPSKQNSYVKMAEILAYKDTSTWNSEDSNNNWRNWPDAGEL